MVGPDYIRTMARYNRWQNENLYTAAQGLTPEARRLDHGAFFGSIEATLNHLLWGDRMWMHRFAGHDRPPGGIADSVRTTPDWEALCRERAQTDTAILAWADAVSPERLAGDLTWWSGALGRDVSKPFGLLVVHFFNHQTHHRGQVHAMLTAAGARPGDTDLFAMPPVSAS